MEHSANTKHAQQQQIVALTSFMIHKHYCENDVESLISLFDPSISWFGTAEQEYAVGADVVAGIFRQFAGQIPRCNITDEQYHVVELGPDIYLCSGRMWITTDPSTNIFLRVHQRVTMVFRFTDGAARCCHIHISNPYSEMTEDDVGFPKNMAQQSYEYLQEQVHAQKKQVEAQASMLWRMSFEDSLTELYNRNKFNRDMAAFQNADGPMGIVFFDMNGLKPTNDRQGHDAGDQLLRRMSACIRKFFPRMAYRMGGDEIVVVDLKSDEARFRTRVESARAAMGQEGISCSVGFSWRACDCSLQDQYAEAERMMYLEKRQFYQLHENDRRGRRET